MSKQQCLIMPAQSGKTKKAEDIMEETYKTLTEMKMEEDGKELNLWMTANNRLLVNQTIKRFEKEIPHVLGKCIAWTCSSKDITPEKLVLDILNNQLGMIAMCGNGKRVTHLVTLIKLLSRQKHFGSRKINLWVDEGDQFIRILDKTIKLFETMAIVNKIVYITATPTPLFSKYKIMYVIPYSQSHPECYVKLDQCTRIHVDYITINPSNYARHIMDKFPELCKPGQRAYIPGRSDTQSHDEICELLVEKRFAVIILNGKRKQLYIPDQLTIDLEEYISEDSHEFNQVLSRLYIEHSLYRFPFAITGLRCIERGITFYCAPSDNHRGFMFDYGIIPSILQKGLTYQVMARLFGNISHFTGYNPPVIYSTTRNFNNVLEEQTIAINLSRISHETQRDMTKDDIKIIRKSVKPYKAPVANNTIWYLFDTKHFLYQPVTDYLKDSETELGRGRVRNAMHEIIPDFRRLNDLQGKKDAIEWEGQRNMAIWTRRNKLYFYKYVR